MWSEIKQAARQGVLLGVQYGIAVLLVLIAISWFVGDYSTVRQRALNGQQAFEFLVEQQKKNAIPAGAVQPVPPVSPEQKK